MEELDVPVPGGTLRVRRWPGDGPVVLAAHGITANGAAWAPVARALAGSVTLVAPDLRGRAGSAAAPGPYGLARHADDLIALLDHLDVDRAVLAGHSMGAFVTALAATRHPERVAATVLVDGGLALRVPIGVDIDEILTAVIGPAMQRLSMTFPDEWAYLDFWKAHPALGPWWSADLERYVLADLVGTPPELRSSCLLAAIRQDARDTLLDEGTTTAIHRLRCPAVLVYAERGLMNEPQGFYDPDRIAATGLDTARVPTLPVTGANHYTVLLTEPGVTAVADQIRTLAAYPAGRP
ncbi:alpha/beta hydrolase [Plantactinospora sp. GCM10030261]|uniref:alpha/beta hydrolase n=1 Tax=Plantactinospora sp. GCM10030261 TaxID=3273420 RepID=UPI0036123214